MNNMSFETIQHFKNCLYQIVELVTLFKIKYSMTTFTYKNLEVRTCDLHLFIYILYKKLESNLPGILVCELMEIKFISVFYVQ